MAATFRPLIALIIAATAGSISHAQPKTIPTTSTKVTLNVDGIKSVEDAVFEATFVIDKEALKALVLEAKIEVENLGKTKGKVDVNLNIPANYMVTSMTLQEEIDLSTNRLELFQVYEGDKLNLLHKLGWQPAGQG